jgi:hypothetical protein
VIQRNFPAPAWLDLKTFAPQPSRAAGGHDDILAAIERLAELHARGILTEAEFSTKKAELLARL